MKKTADKRNSGNGCKNVSDRDVQQLKTTTVNNPLLTNWEVLTRWEELRTLNEIFTGSYRVDD